VYLSKCTMAQTVAKFCMRPKSLCKRSNTEKARQSLQSQTHYDCVKSRCLRRRASIDIQYVYGMQWRSEIVAYSLKIQMLDKQLMNWTHSRRIDLLTQVSISSAEKKYCHLLLLFRSSQFCKQPARLSASIDETSGTATNFTNFPPFG